MLETQRPLKVFLSYASQDKPVVRELSRRLVGEGWIDTWFDEKKLLPGQDWRVAIEEAVEDSDIVIICLSSNSVSKEGHVQKELRYAREIALEKPEGTVFIIPLRLDECEVPRGLRFYQWVDYFGERKAEGYDSLVESLKLRYEQKLRLEQEEGSRQEKSRKEREAAEKIAREKAEQDAAEKARLKAEEQARQKAIKDKTEREAAEKAAREKKEKETAEKARLAAEELARQKAAKEKTKRDADEENKRDNAKGKVTEVKPETQKSQGDSYAFLWAIGVVVLIFVIWLISLQSTPSTTSATPTVSSTKVSANTAESLSAEIIDSKSVPMRLIPTGDNGPFYIDKYLVTNARYSICVDDGSCQAPTNSSSATRSSYYGNPQFVNYPVVYVDWNMALSYCEWRGAQLPTGAQWLKAAYGTDYGKIDGRTYPWGNGIDCSYANYGSCASDTTEVGIYENGKSPYGVYDMVGNVWEWLADSVYGGDGHLARGGSFGMPEATVHTSASDNGSSNFFGFRCVRNP